jgi:type IV pilus assembly protein PilB
MDRKQKLLGEILIEKSLITPEQLKSALEEQVTTKEFLGAILIGRRYIQEVDLLKALSEQFNIPFIKLRDKYIDWELVKQFSSSLILDYKCIPIKKDDYSITIALTNPLDAWLLKKAEEEAKGLNVKMVLASQADIQEVIERYKQYMRRHISDLFK